MATGDPLDPNHLFGHVQDADYFEVPRALSPHGDGRINIPQPLARPKQGPDGQPIVDAHGQPEYEAIWTPNTGNQLMDQIIQPVRLKLTKFMVLEVIVAVILVAIFMRLASKMRGGAHVKGRVWNMLEAMLVLWKRIVDSGGRMAVCNASPTIRDILRVSRFETLWPVCDTLDSALAVVGGEPRA